MLGEGSWLSAPCAVTLGHAADVTSHVSFLWAFLGSVVCYPETLRVFQGRTQDKDERSR